MDYIKSGRSIRNPVTNLPFSEFDRERLINFYNRVKDPDSSILERLLVRPPTVYPTIWHRRTRGSNVQTGFPEDCQVNERRVFCESPYYEMRDNDSFLRSTTGNFRACRRGYTFNADRTDCIVDERERDDLPVDI